MHACIKKSIYCYKSDNYKNMKYNILQKQFTEALRWVIHFTTVMLDMIIFWDAFNIYNIMWISYSLFLGVKLSSYW